MFVSRSRGSRQPNAAAHAQPVPFLQRTFTFPEVLFVTSTGVALAAAAATAITIPLVKDGSINVRHQRSFNETRVLTLEDTVKVLDEKLRIARGINRNLELEKESLRRNAELLHRKQP